MMVAAKLDGNKNKKCAFCKYWYDPTNQYIMPYDPKHGMWKFDQNARCMCLKYNLQKGAAMRCDKFELKIV